RAGTSKSGKPWPRLTAPCSCASCDITVKMVVPTFGNLLCNIDIHPQRDREARQFTARPGSVKPCPDVDPPGRFRRDASHDAAARLPGRGVSLAARRRLA